MTVRIKKQMESKVYCNTRTEYINKDGKCPSCGEMCDNFGSDPDKKVYCDYCKGWNDCLDEFALK